MPGILDFTHYTTEMRKSLIDKIFFMDKLDEDAAAILDYGCADGVLVDFLAAIFPETAFVGYDQSPAMIEAAKARSAAPNAAFFSDFDAAMADLASRGIAPDRVGVNLSSLIHEVYSYGTPESIEAFWRDINGRGFRYITIRDMCCDQSAHRPALKEDVLKARRSCPAKQIEEFEACHGSLSDNYNLLHFLMKYRYLANWDRECAENYLPLTVEQFIGKLSGDYELIYFDHYVLPFLARVVRQDMDITIKDYTHVKLILRRKGL
ncbi:MAG: class I SAM-dependent methyltransferase [Clostridia bacterium]|nr:class I SAM-dependent methyltransferase [Clostridia bacterium]